MNSEDLRRHALCSNADYSAVIETSAIQFYEDVRRACEQNACGKYDTSWTGPPAIGPIDVLKKRVLRYKQGLLFQTVHPTGGSSDMKGMFEAARSHEAIFRDFLQQIKDNYPGENILPLDAGCCSYCERCAYLDKEPCRNPDQALSSVEAYGMNVAALMKIAGMPYNHGKGALGFVGLILFDPRLTFKR
jgi:predicted metal-binding protein